MVSYNGDEHCHSNHEKVDINFLIYTIFWQHLSWTSDLTGFDVLDNHSSVLLGWIGGKGAEVMEELSDEEVGSHCTEVLKACIPTTAIPLPQSVIRYVL